MSSVLLFKSGHSYWSIPLTPSISFQASAAGSGVPMMPPMMMGQPMMGQPMRPPLPGAAAPGAPVTHMDAHTHTHTDTHSHSFSDTFFPNPQTYTGKCT